MLSDTRKKRLFERLGTIQSLGDRAWQSIQPEEAYDLRRWLLEYGDPLAEKIAGEWITVNGPEDLPPPVAGFYRVAYLRKPEILFWCKSRICTCWAFLSADGRWQCADAGSRYGGWYVDTHGGVVAYWSIPHLLTPRPEVPDYDPNRKSVQPLTPDS